MARNSSALTRGIKKAKGVESTLLNNNLRGSLEDFPIVFEQQFVAVGCEVDFGGYARREVLAEGFSLTNDVVERLLPHIGESAS